MARDWFKDQALAVGANYKVNTVGAQFAILPGEDNTIPPIGMGSHLDSVITGGRFDGVLSGLEVLRSFKEHKIKTRAPVAVINWTNEEGSRFTPGLGASTVWAEQSTVQEALASTTHDGSPTTMGDELKRIGYIGQVPSSSSEFPLSAHFEVHVEQNTELENAGNSVGWAEGWQGIIGFEVTFQGDDGHATTYAMPRHRDALVGAAKVITALDQLANDLAGFTTPTAIRSGPFGFCNIQSKAKVAYLMGNMNEGKLLEMYKRLEQTVEDIAAMHRLEFHIQKVVDLPPGNFTSEAVDCVARACGSKGKVITCMSGHDSLMTILRVPTAMIFVRSKGGVSHSPKEWSEKEDCADGALALGQAVLNFDEYLSHK